MFKLPPPSAAELVWNDLIDRSSRGAVHLGLVGNGEKLISEDHYQNGEVLILGHRPSGTPLMSAMLGALIRDNRGIFAFTAKEPLEMIGRMRLAEAAGKRSVLMLPARASRPWQPLIDRHPELHVYEVDPVRMIGLAGHRHPQDVTVVHGLLQSAGILVSEQDVHGAPGLDELLALGDWPLPGSAEIPAAQRCKDPLEHDHLEVPLLPGAAPDTFGALALGGLLCGLEYEADLISRMMDVVREALEEERPQSVLHVDLLAVPGLPPEVYTSRTGPGDVVLLGYLPDLPAGRSAYGERFESLLEVFSRHLVFPHGGRLCQETLERYATLAGAATADHLMGLPPEVAVSFTEDADPPVVLSVPGLGQEVFVPAPDTERFLRGEGTRETPRPSPYLQVLRAVRVSNGEQN